MFACIKFLTYKNDDVGLIIRAIDVPYRKKKEPTNQMIIQVVDDEFDIVNLIKLCLQEIGLNAVGFTDSSLAFEHFRINSKDCMLVISDIRIPGMNGFEFVRKIREINPVVKVLLMSAFEVNSAELSAGIGEAKIDGFIQKPVSLADLNNLVRKQLEIKTLSS